MSKVEKLQLDIANCNRLAEIGVAIYNYNMVGEFMHNAIFYEHRAERLTRDLEVLVEDYGIIL